MVKMIIINSYTFKIKVLVNVNIYKMLNLKKNLFSSRNVTCPTLRRHMAKKTKSAYELVISVVGSNIYCRYHPSALIWPINC